MSLESRFQTDLIEDLRDLFPGCIILKNDSSYLQGFPDLLILYNNKWAVLEIKRNQFSPQRPNQEYYIELCKSMSYASFIFPENKGQVLNELQQAFRSRRTTRISKRI